MDGYIAGDEAGRTNRFSAFTAWDRELAGLLRLASCDRVFPISIAYPAWSHPVADIDPAGHGALAFPSALTLRREAAIGAPTADGLRA